MGVPVVIGGDNLPSPIGIGLTDLPHDGGEKVYYRKNKEKWTQKVLKTYITRVSTISDAGSNRWG